MRLGALWDLPQETGNSPDNAATKEMSCRRRVAGVAALRGVPLHRGPDILVYGKQVVRVVRGQSVLRASRSGANGICHV